MPQAGFPDGAGFEGPGAPAQLPGGVPVLLEPLATEVQTSLAQIGINFELNPIPNAQFVDLLLVQGTLPAWLREKDIVIGPDAGYHAQLSYTSPETGLPVDNGQKYRNDTVDELFFQAKVATGQERLDLLEEIQVILYEDLPRIPARRTTAADRGSRGSHRASDRPTTSESTTGTSETSSGSEQQTQAGRRPGAPPCFLQTGPARQADQHARLRVVVAEDDRLHGPPEPLDARDIPAGNPHKSNAAFRVLPHDVATVDDQAAPMVEADSGEARYAIASATSSGSTSRPCSVAAIARSRSASGSALSAK